MVWTAAVFSWWSAEILLGNWTEISVKLHATLMNTQSKKDPNTEGRYNLYTTNGKYIFKERVSFDGWNILKLYENFYFASLKLNSILISHWFTVSSFGNCLLWTNWHLLTWKLKVLTRAAAKKRWWHQQDYALSPESFLAAEVAHSLQTSRGGMLPDWLCPPTWCSAGMLLLSPTSCSPFPLLPHSFIPYSYLNSWFPFFKSAPVCVQEFVYQWDYTDHSWIN